MTQQGWDFVTPGHPPMSESADFPALTEHPETGYTNLSLLEDGIDGIYSAVLALGNRCPDAT